MIITAILNKIKLGRPLLENGADLRVIQELLDLRLIYYINTVRFFKMQTWLSDRIQLDPAVCHGKPVVRGTRVFVANVVGAIAAGQSHVEILEDYPALTEADIRACLEFAGELTAMETAEA